MRQRPTSNDPQQRGTSRVELQEKAVNALRAYGAISEEVTREFARTLDLHPTDAGALIEILEAEERGAPLSPAPLSERIGLTTGATSSLLNRLEDAGHIERTRVHRDRRVVTLQSSPTVRDAASEFFDPLGARFSAAMKDFPTESLEHLDALLTALGSAAQEYIEELRSSPGN